MKKKRIIEISLVILGIGLIAFPIISNYVSSYSQTVAITNYQQEMENMTEEKKEKEKEKAQKYNEELEKETIVDLSLDSNENNTEKNEEEKSDGNASYLNVLNIGEVMAYISIPKIDLYLPIYHGLSENVLQSGIGHSEKTSLPVGGSNTHCVLAGHTGLARTKIFDNINKLEQGDKFYINSLGDVLEYEVDKIDIVKPNKTDMIKIEDGKDYVTLVTCTPPVLNTHRLLVRGTRIQNADGEIENANIQNVEKVENIQENNKEIIKNQFEHVKKKNISKVYLAIILATTLIIVLLVAFRKDFKAKNFKGDENLDMSTFTEKKNKQNQKENS